MVTAPPPRPSSALVVVFVVVVFLQKHCCLQKRALVIDTWHDAADVGMPKPHTRTHVPARCEATPKKVKIKTGRIPRPSAGAIRKNRMQEEEDAAKKKSKTIKLKDFNRVVYFCTGAFKHSAVELHCV